MKEIGLLLLVGLLGLAFKFLYDWNKKRKPQEGNQPVFRFQESKGEKICFFYSIIRNDNIDKFTVEYNDNNSWTQGTLSSCGNSKCISISSGEEYDPITGETNYDNCSPKGSEWIEKIDNGQNIFVKIRYNDLIFAKEQYQKFRVLMNGDYLNLVLHGKSF